MMATEDPHIYYLAQRYTGDIQKSANDAWWYTYLLRLKGYVVFSPILHNHWYDQQVRNAVAPPSIEGLDTFEQCLAIRNEYLAEEDYVKWDLALLDALSYQIPGNARELQLRLLFAPSCFKLQAASIWLGMDHVEWASEGAKTEYDWALTKKVPCYLLEPFLRGEEVLI